MNLRQIEARLALVLKTSEGLLPAEQLEEMQSLVEAGEPGIALEDFCTQLEEYDVVVPEGVVTELRVLASAMEMELSPWVERGGHS